MSNATTAVDCTLTDWISAIGTWLLFIAAVLIALFSEKIKSYWNSPKLDIELHPFRPDCHRTIVWKQSTSPERAPKTETKRPSFTTGEGVPVYQWSFYGFYWRIKIWNRGKGGARNVEVLFTDFERNVGGDTFEKDSSFAPDNLVWSTYFDPGGGEAAYLPSLPPGVWKYCNLGYIYPRDETEIMDPEKPKCLGTDEVVFQVQLKWRSFLGFHQLEPGTYRFTIMAAASNANLVRKRFEMEVTGKWFEDEVRMLTEGVGIREL